MTIVPGLKSIGGLWIVQVVRMALSILVSVLVIRYLGPEQFGVLGIAGACVLLFSPLVGLPLGGLIVRELAKVNEDGVGSSQVLSTAFDMRLAGAACQVVLSLAAVGLLGYGRDITLAATCMALAGVVGPFSVLASGLEFDGRFDRIAMIDLAASVWAMLLRLVLVWNGAALIWFAAAGILDASVYAVLFGLASRRRRQLQPLAGFSPALARVYFRDGWPLVLAGIAFAVTTRADVIFISQLLGEREAGWYTAAIRMTEVLYYFPTVIASTYFPTLARRRQDDADGYYRLVTNSCGAAFWLAVVLAAGLAITAPLALPLLLGPKFIPSIAVVQISAWTIVPVALATAFGSSLMIEHATRVQLYAAVGAAIVNVVLNLALIPPLGLAGAALAGVLAQTASFLALVVFYRDARLIAALAGAMSPRFPVLMGRTVWALLRGPAKS